eukprot:COSAG02_NODE_41632_length_392_cov_1.197952_2_plen_39_part_01
MPIAFLPACTNFVGCCADVKNNTFRTTVGAVLNGMHIPS